MANSNPTRSTKKLPRVTVLVDTSSEWGRSLIQGVANYAKRQGRWQLQIEARGRNDRMNLPSNWIGDGIIARVASEKLSRDLQSRNAKVVNVSGIEVDGPPLPRVTTDFDACAKLAAEHFLARGFQRFAYVGSLKTSFVKRQAAAFQRQIAASDGVLETFDCAFASISNERWTKQQKRLGEWLLQLEKPVAIYCWGTVATHLLDVCCHLGIHVPDEVAVLSGENDDLICNATVPPVSSILVPARQIGYRAAERLHKLMEGETDPGDDEKIAPIEIVTRESTDALAIEDQELCRAVRYIRDHAFGSLTVQEVADSVPMTRRSLERKFKEWINRTPLAEIRRMRIARAKELLATTDLPVPKVAAASGFQGPEYMTTLFKQETGLTPLRFRASVRAR